VYALRRFAAYGIDSLFLMLPGYFVISFLIPRLLGEGTLTAVPFLLWGVSLAFPVAVLGLLIGFTGRTPGKLIMFLKVQDRYGRAPGVAQALLREVVKAVSFSFVCGALWALYGLVTSGRTFYDDWLGLEVEDLSTLGLTDVQKNWRKQMRQSQTGSE
jgi:uncharacterized RDD family membrane protein YckC